MTKNKLNIPFGIGQRVKTRYKPPVEGIITSILIKEGNYVQYECSYPGSDGLISNWMTRCEFDVLDKAETTVGFKKK